MRYFLYDNITENIYFKDFKGKKLEDDIDISSPTISRLITQYLNKVGAVEFENTLRELNIKFDTIDFNTRTYTINNETLFFGEFSRGEQWIIYSLMVKEFNLPVILRGIMESLSYANKEKVAELFKGYNNGTIIALSNLGIPKGAVDLGDGYYEY